MLNNLKRGDKIITSGGIICTINKVLENKELLVQVSDNVEIKLAPGMVADLYILPSIDKNIKNVKTENNKGSLLSGLLNKKK